MSKKTKVRLQIFRGLTPKRGLGAWILTRTYKRIKNLEEWNTLVSSLLYDVFEYRNFTPKFPCMAFYDETPYLYKKGVFHRYVAVFYPEDMRKLLVLLRFVYEGDFPEEYFKEETPISEDEFYRPNKDRGKDNAV